MRAILGVFIHGFHAFSRCDQIGKYNGISKARLVKMYLSSTTDQVNCFEMLGQDNLLSHDMDTLNDGLSKFLTKAYTTQGITAANIEELRWQLFSKKQLTSDKLPPTMRAFKWKVLRVHYLTLVWKRSLQNFEAEYSDLLQFGWKSNLDNSGHLPLIAVVTEELPAPEATLELTYCGCKQLQIA